MTEQEAILALQAIAERKLYPEQGWSGDPETQHGDADSVLLEYLTTTAPAVVAAYGEVRKRCRWWAYA